jgi:arylsulfatase A-like enzyme
MLRSHGLAVALATGVSAAAIDVLSGVLSGGFWSSLAMAASAAIVLGLFVFLALTLGGLLSFWERRDGSGSNSLSHLTAAALLTTSFAAFMILKFATSRMGFDRTILEALACALPLIGWVLARFVAHRPRLRALAFAFPYWLVATALFEWLRRFPDASGRLPPMLLLSGYVVAMALGAVVALTSGRSGRVERGLVVLASVIAVAPLGASMTNRKGNPAAASMDAPRLVKRVILITVDTLRADAVSGAVTPRLQELSRDSLIFTNAISPAPWTLPAVSSLMTGVSPDVHGGTSVLSKVSSRFETLAERLEGAGYLTAALGSNPVLLPERNLGQGFMEYDFYPRLTSLKSLGAALLKRIWPEEFRLNVSDQDITELALAWVREHRSYDFFLWVHYIGPHQPYSPSPQFSPPSVPPPGMESTFGKFRQVRLGLFVPDATQRAWIQELYRGDVRSTDREVGVFIDGLRDIGLYDDSLIVMTSDHGEEFWEHDGFEHGHTLYQELLAVPLMIKAPGSQRKGAVSGFVSTERVMATVLEACGVRYEPQDIAPPLPLRDAPDTRPEPVVSSFPLYYEDRIAVRFERYWYIRSLLTDVEELYDLEKDAKEQFSIAQSAQQELQRARDLLVGWKERTRALRELYSMEVTERIPLEPRTEQMLRALGYVQ